MLKKKERIKVRRKAANGCCHLMSVLKMVLFLSFTAIKTAIYDKIWLYLML